MIAPLVGAVASLAGTAYNNSTSQSNARVAFKQQKELMALQQRYATENWQREVNYNDPLAQRRRLSAAGLNPDLIYGNGAAGLEAPSTAAPTAPSSQMASTFGMSNFAMDAANVAQAVSAADKANSETLKNAIENEYATRTLDKRVEEVALRNGWTKSQTDKAKAEISQIGSLISEINSRIRLMGKQENLIDSEIGLNNAKSDLTTKQGDVAVEAKRLTSYQADVVKKRVDTFDAAFWASMRAMDDQHHLSKEEYARLIDTHELFVESIKSDINKTQASTENIEADTKLSNQIFDLNEDFAAIEREFGLVGRFLKLLAGFMTKSGKK